MASAGEAAALVGVGAHSLDSRKGLEVGWLVGSPMDQLWEAYEDMRIGGEEPFVDRLAPFRTEMVELELECQNYPRDPRDLAYRGAGIRGGGDAACADCPVWLLEADPSWRKIDSSLS